MWKSYLIHLEGKRGKDIPKITWEEGIKKYLISLHLTKNIALNQAGCKKRIRGANLNEFGIKVLLLFVFAGIIAL